MPEKWKKRKDASGNMKNKIKKSKKKNRKDCLLNRRGFSMLEMLIAGFILSVGMIGMLRLVVENLRNSTDSRDHVVASGLAQEGLELVRNMRDNATNPLVGSFEKLPSGTTIDDCKVDINSTDMLSGSCGADIDKKLYVNSNFYDHTAVPANVTRFQRKIRLQYQNKNGNPMTKDNGTPDRADDAYQVKIQSMVIWQANSFPAFGNCNLQNKCVGLESTLAERH